MPRMRSIGVISSSTADKSKFVGLINPKIKYGPMLLIRIVLVCVRHRRRGIGKKQTQIRALDNL